MTNPERLLYQMYVAARHQDKRVKAGLKPSWRVLNMLEKEEKKVKE